MLQVTYQKGDGNVICRLRNTMPPYKIGDTTSMGWKVLNIEYEYKNKYYSEYQYNKIIQNNKKKYIKRKQKTESFLKETKTFFYYFIAVLIISFLKTFIGI